MRIAERLDPNSPVLATMFALVFYNARRYEESLKKTRRALELDPDYYIALQSLGWICPRLGRFDEAIEGCRRAVLINDQQALNKFSLALALIDAGQTKEANAIAAELEARRRNEQVPAYYSALLYASLGEDEKAFEWLDEAIKERGYYTLRMRVEPRFDRLRGDRRFAKPLAEIKTLSESKTTASVVSRDTGNVEKPGRLKFKRASAAAMPIVVLFVPFRSTFIRRIFNGSKRSSCRILSRLSARRLKKGRRQKRAFRRRSGERALPSRKTAARTSHSGRS